MTHDRQGFYTHRLGPFCPPDPALCGVVLRCRGWCSVDPDTLLTGAQAARAANVTRQLIHGWVRLGQLHPADHTDDGTPRYRLGDVWAAERTTRRSAFSSRNPARAA